jgi:hypothetical protein
MWLNRSAALEYDLSVDPCPDCDVRFSEHSRFPIVAPTSILVENRWSRRLFNNTVLLVGLPDHITCAYLNERSRYYEFEYFDPAGRDGDRKSISKLRRWAENELPKLLGKRVQFVQSKPMLNFQSDPHDVMCQTWIWFWVYFRIIRKRSHLQITKQVKIMIQKDKSLIHIHLFGRNTLLLYFLVKIFNPKFEIELKGANGPN